MAEQICRGDHSGHICVLANHQKFEEIKTLTQKPEFICFNCGRVAIAKRIYVTPCSQVVMQADQPMAYHQGQPSMLLNQYAERSASNVFCLLKAGLIWVTGSS